ncbi:hypothetical protein [Peribacillus frigoritolerans]|uniref:hypothetical protein n=1 Tax=Peribacillus castrilensis TaxID=2897690 RepID=UPI002DCC5979|nr:hypothetical protein [Peribacillus castrilensis]
MKDKLVLKRVWNKTSQQFLLLKHKVDWNVRYETPAGKAWHGRPRRRAEEAPARPRKASAWSGNQHLKIVIIPEELKVFFVDTS